MDLAKINADRYADSAQDRLGLAAGSRQQTSGYQQAEANLAAADANVRRLEELEVVQARVRAVHGVLTKRNVDPGALINAGAGAGKELFDIARVDPLRVYVSVPQAYAPAIKIGMEACGHVAGISGTEVHGHGGAHRGGHRSHDAHVADRSRRAQQRRRAAARLVR